MFENKWRLVSLALLAVIGIIAGAIYAAGHGGTEFRVLGIRHDDGRVEVGVQQQGMNGGWGDTILPEHRFLPADITGKWLHSSPVSLSAAMHEGPSMEAMPDDLATDGRSDKLYCIVHHGAADDRFWQDFNGAARFELTALGLNNVEIYGKPDLAEQSAAIMDCVDRGAAGIASSIPDLDGLRDALAAVARAVRERDAHFITFNSGADFAKAAGASRHYGLDDRAAGELAGREFAAAGLTGSILCIIHERTNVGLRDRCGGLASAYGGKVEEVVLPDGSLGDAMAAGRAIGEALETHDAAGVLVLNAQLNEPAVAAARSSGGDMKIGSIGGAETFLLVFSGQMLFMIPDGAIDQAGSIALSFKGVDTRPPTPTVDGTVPAEISAITKTSVILTRPDVINAAIASQLPSEWSAGLCQNIESMQLDAVVEEFCGE